MTIKNNHYLSIDIGASSGRFVVSSIDDGNVKFYETYRFPNSSYEKDNHLFWDFELLMEHIYKGIQESFSVYPDINSIGIDTWGVDYGLIDKSGRLIHNPYCYRDSRTQDIVSEYHNKNDFRDLYNQTGIQQMHFNTIYQLIDEFNNHIDDINKTENLLMIPDLITYYLTGNKQVEITNLSTTALYNPNTNKIIEIKGINRNLFPEIVEPLQNCGYLKEDLQEELSVPKTKIISVSTHDTASAILSVPINKRLFISSGTWSLIGTVLDKPFINEDSLKYNFTNELLINHQVGFLKNTMGMWIMSQVLSEWKAKGHSYNYKQVSEMFRSVDHFESRIDCNHPLFEKPNDMVEKINKYLLKTQQYFPANHSEYIYMIYHSMVLAYEEIISNLEKTLNHKYDEIVIIGGGSENDTLNQLIANKTKKTVIQGYKEATILGNAMCLWIEDKRFKDVNDCKNKLNEILTRKIYKPILGSEGKR